MYAHQGNHPAAEPHYLDVLAIQERLLGNDYPDSIGVREAIARLQQQIKHQQ